MVPWVPRDSAPKWHDLESIGSAVLGTFCTVHHLAQTPNHMLYDGAPTLLNSAHARGWGI